MKCYPAAERVDAFLHSAQRSQAYLLSMIWINAGSPRIKLRRRDGLARVGPAYDGSTHPLGRAFAARAAAARLRRVPRRSA